MPCPRLRSCSSSNVQDVVAEADGVDGTVGPTLLGVCSAVGSHEVGGHDRSHGPEVRVVHPGSMGCASLAMPNPMMPMTHHGDVHDHVGETPVGLV